MGRVLNNFVMPMPAKPTSSMQSDNFELNRDDGTSLFVKHWRPNGGAKATVLIVHGVNEHCDRYSQLVKALLENNYAVVSYDQRGHGRSSGQRVHIFDWQEYREDMDAVVNTTTTRPAFLYGHSMGAMVVADYVLHHPTSFQGVLLSGVPIQPTGVAKPALVLLAKILTHIWPRCSVNLGINPAHLSRDSEVVRAFQDDPMCTTNATVRWGTEMLACIERVKANADALQVPLLILHGGADALNHPDGARWLHDQAGSENKCLQIYPGGYHEPHNDLHFHQVCTDVVAWLDGQLLDLDSRAQLQ